LVLLHSWLAPQAAHAAPPVPHDPLLSDAYGSQLVPLQQPAHDPPPQLHAPPEQESPLPHALHAAPAVPHCPAVCAA
jgi:hypothetical protein